MCLHPDSMRRDRLRVADAVSQLFSEKFHILAGLEHFEKHDVRVAHIFDVVTRDGRHITTSLA